MEHIEHGIHAPITTNPMSLRVEQFGDRKIVIKGIGKMFYEDGFPIAISFSEAKKRGWEVSVLHVADELLKNGWTAKRIVATIEAAMDDDIDKSMGGDNIGQVSAFCWSSYERQREMIFQYLFGSREVAVGWFRDSNKIIFP